jgi:predicted  nucleic acid-binding Zn-ribbon protein
MPRQRTMSGFACQECGHRFKTIAAAERASFGPNGCPKCGGSDIDLGVRDVADPIDNDRGDEPMELDEEGLDRWARHYDSLNGAPDGPGDV